MGCCVIITAVAFPSLALSRRTPALARMVRPGVEGCSAEVGISHVVPQTVVPSTQNEVRRGPLFAVPWNEEIENVCETRLRRARLGGFREFGFFRGF
jgi:hypothetical protein